MRRHDEEHKETVNVGNSEVKQLRLDKNLLYIFCLFVCLCVCMFSMRSAVRWPILTKPASMDLDVPGTVIRPPKSLDWPEGNLGEPKNRNFGRAPWRMAV
jgi:hypothetical protein